MIPYTGTITWLKFQVDLDSAPPLFWTLLGSINTQTHLLRNAPLTVSEVRALEREVLIGGLQARLAQDGILLSFEQLDQRLSGERSASATDERVDELVRAWRTEHGEPREIAFTTERIKALHRACFPSGGEWRTSDAEGVPSELIGLFMDELCDWLNGPLVQSPTEEQSTAFAVIRMLLAELYLAWIRPFDKGLARVTGSTALEILTNARVPSALAHLAARQFFLRQVDFQDLVERSKSGPADPIPFLLFGLTALSQALDQLHCRMRLVQLNGQWRAQLFDLFSEANDAPTRRQRQLLLDLGEYDEAITLGKLQSLTPALAAFYAGVSEKTLRRDVDALALTGLVVKSPNGVYVDRSAILAFKR